MNYSLRKSAGWGAGLFLVAALLSASVLAFTDRVEASSDKYKFTVRGIVREVTPAAKTIRVYVTYASSAAKDELLGNTQDFNVNSAKFYKWSGDKKSRTTLSKVAQVGDEVVLYGQKKGEDQFSAATVTTNDRTFEVVGLLREYNSSDGTLRMEASFSTYKNSQFKGKDIWIGLLSNTKVYASSGAEMNTDELKANDQKIKVKGVMEGSNWKVNTIWNEYKKAK